MNSLTPHMRHQSATRKTWKGVVGDLAAMLPLKPMTYTTQSRGVPTTRRIRMPG